MSAGDYVFTDGNGVPDFAVDLATLEAEALSLAGRLAMDCDSPEKVSAHLEQLSLSGGRHPAYLSALTMRALRFFSEDLFSPVLALAEHAAPEHDIRGRLAIVAEPAPRPRERDQ